MEFDVYFRIGITCCGPFPAEAMDEKEMLEEAVGFHHELGLPPATIIIISPRNHPPIWGHPGAKKCRNFGFGAKMGPLKEPDKAMISQGGIIITN